MPPWTPYFGDSGLVAAPGYYQTVLDVPVPAVPNILESATRTVGDGSIWSDVITDYVLALHHRRIAHEVTALLTGGAPHARNWVPGGVCKAPDATECATMRSKLQTVRDFILTHYVPLALIVTWLYNPYDNDIMNGTGASGTGVGAGYGNFLSYGVYNEPGANTATAENVGPIGNPAKRVIARGYDFAASGAVIFETAIGQIEAQIKEEVDNSWYNQATDGLAPSVGITDPVPRASKPAAYSFAKAPRLSGNPMEVGPLARLWVSGDYRAGVVIPALNTLPHAGNGGALAGASANALGAPANVTCGVSVMDRHRARAVEAVIVINRMLGYSRLNLTPGSPAQDAAPGWLDMVDPSHPSYVGGSTVGNLSLPASGNSGYGLTEAPRGALGHWITAGSAGRIAHYQCVVPTTWNGSPSDGVNPGPIEMALVGGLFPPGTTISGILSSGQLVPVEALRVVHSFDPCIACAVHVVDAKGNKLGEYKKIR